MTYAPGAPLDEDGLVDGRALVHEFVRREIAAMERRRKELVGLLWRTGLDYTACTFEMHCPHCHKIGGGNCTECSSYHDGIEPISGVNPRVWRLVDKNETECWLWRGSRDSKGYAAHEGSKLHRVFYELSGGDLRGLVVHHVCRVKHCVNPKHMEALTKSEHGTKHYKEANP